MRSCLSLEQGEHKINKVTGNPICTYIPSEASKRSTYGKANKSDFKKKRYILLDR